MNNLTGKYEADYLAVAARKRGMAVPTGKTKQKSGILGDS